MHEPFYCRPLDYLYILRSESGHGWWTGLIRGDQQFLRSPSAVIFFSRDGDVIRAGTSKEYPIPPEWETNLLAAYCCIAWPVELGFVECPIRVKRFWLPDWRLGIEDLPDGLAEYYTAPDGFEGDSESVHWWIDVGQYVFHSGCGEYWMSREGDVESS